MSSMAVGSVHPPHTPPVCVCVWGGGGGWGNSESLGMIITHRLLSSDSILTSFFFNLHWRDFKSTLGSYK